MNEEKLIVITIITGACVLLPIVYMLIKHQQTMAKIIHERQGQNDDGLRSEVEQLKQLVMNQTLALDNLAQQQRELARPPVADPVERLNA
jgi:hypothetical protein